MLLFRGVRIPFAVRLYAKKEYCKKTGKRFYKSTELAAQIISSFSPPEGLNVYVLFDSYYLCSTVITACREKGFHFVSVAKSNRNVLQRRGKRKVRGYAREMLRRYGKVLKVGRGKRVRRFRVAERLCRISKVGFVKSVVSRIEGEKRVLCIVSDDEALSAKEVIEFYSNRFLIEVLIREAKQHLGFGDYQVRDWRGVERHLHLVMLAGCLLTHFGLVSLGAEAKSGEREKLLPSLGVLRERLRNSV